ncbi:hypothetical protein C2G38_2243422 [Gigaspora rosea]|uniref:Uncharacterized protein n=1 Tax=Gigaspora rosea TaxID=44941 RepID=A0A397VLP8_9GLOM|nr:hypothetical protein C2G38_2243422 [Gigaspora rosea]
MTDVTTLVRAGEGKSTLANMLIQDDIGPDNIFPIGDSAVGETSEVVYAFNDYFEVCDIIVYVNHPMERYHIKNLPKR